MGRLCSYTKIVLPMILAVPLCPSLIRAQDSGDQGIVARGDWAEIAVTIVDSSGRTILTSANVKLYKEGMPIAQSSASNGRVFFSPHGRGDFSILVEASGYKNAQRDLTVSTGGKVEIDIVLQSVSGESTEPPGKPVLAPKARDAVVKALKALGDGKLEEAQKSMSEAMKLAPGHPEVLYVQGMVYLKQGKWAEAQTVLEKSAQLDGNQARVLSALGMTLCNQQKYQEAIPPLEKSLQLEPAGNLETDWSLARSYYHVGQYEQALKMTEQARAASHDSPPQLELLLAQCLTAVGRYEDSAQVLRQYLERNPNGPEAATARHWLNSLAANGKIHVAGTPTP
jgi:Tfp pilus assembly protein PilF